jgi:hypothetical protein
MRKVLAGLLASLLLGAVPAPAQSPAWTPQPWLEDLAQARAALDSKYANLEWLLTEREVDLDALFQRARAALGNARSDSDAVAIFNRLVQRIGDGHVNIEWPRPAPSPAPASAGAAAPTRLLPTRESFCRARGYGPPSNAAGLAPALAGYAPVAEGDLLPAGTIPVGRGRIGLLRIAVFDPHVSNTLCAETVTALSIPIDQPCDEACDNRLITEAYRRIGLTMQDRLARLRAAGARVLVVDLTGNGGGSEWAEAAARMLSGRPLQSAPLGFVRGPHWERQWGQLAERLRAAAAGSPADRERLLDWAAEAEAARTEARRTCPPRGDPACPWLGRAGFATGLVGRAPAGGFADKDWAVHVFNPAQHTYRDGVWDGPVIVLTDQETWSAAEQFAAVLQDNGAALILGARTGGAGCGHTWGGTPTRLTNSGATLKLPDCARFRADGSNEVRGILPDQPLSWRANDGQGFRARMLEAALPEAIRRAEALYARQRAR